MDVGDQDLSTTETGKKNEQRLGFLKKLRSEQIARELRLKNKLDKKEKLESLMKELEIGKQREKELRKYEEKTEQLNRMIQQRNERKFRLNELEWEIRRGVTEKPLFLIKEQEYYQKVIVPETNNRQALISVHKNKAIPLDSIKEHAREYSKLKKEASQKRFELLTNKTVAEPVRITSTLSRILTRDFTQVSYKQLRRQNREELVRKRYEYSKTVKLKYPPLANPRKQVEAILKRPENPTEKKIVTPQTVMKKHTKRTTTSETKCVKPNQSMDYISELRKAREVSTTKLLDSFSYSHHSAKEAERALKFLPLSKSWSTQAIHAEQQVNEAIIRNVRQKFSLIKL